MNHIKIKLTPSELEALHGFLMITLTFFEPVGYANMITKEVMHEVLNQLDRMIHNADQKKFTMKLTGSQALSFVAFFSKCDLSKHPYEGVLINRIIETIHKTNLNANIHHTTA